MLAVRRQLPHVIPPVVAAHRLHPLAVVAGHVVIAQVAAVGLEVTANGARDVALVERITAALRDLFQRIGQVRVLPQLAFARRVAVDRELLLEAGILRKPRYRTVPVIRDHLRHRMALARVADRRGQVVRHRLAPETLVQREPAVHCTRHRHRQRPGGRNLLQPAALELGQAERLRRTPRAVVAIQLLRLRIPYDREQVTPHPVAGRLHQPQRGIGRDRRIHRRAAALQHIQRDLGRQRLRGRRHRMRRNHLRTGGEAVAGNPVGSGREHGQRAQQRSGQDGTGKGSGHGQGSNEGSNCPMVAAGTPRAHPTMVMYDTGGSQCSARKPRFNT